MAEKAEQKIETWRGATLRNCFFIIYQTLHFSFENDATCHQTEESAIEHPEQPPQCVGESCCLSSTCMNLPGFSAKDSFINIVPNNSFTHRINLLRRPSVSLFRYVMHHVGSSEL